MTSPPPAEPDPRTPVTVLTGWLGAGKTTLLNRLLEHARGSGARFAVLVNEFGELSIDDRLVVATEENLVELAGGCVCCTVRGDLVLALERLERRARGGLWRRARPLDRVLVETTGLAEPGPLVKTFLAEERVRASYRPPSVVTLVDARAAELALVESAAREQLGVADRIVLNKVDLVAREQADELAARLARMNPLAALERASFAAVDAAELLCAEPAPRGLGARAEGLHATHVHDLTSLALCTERPLDEMKLRLWIDACVHLCGARLVRYKGFARVRGRAEPLVLQGVYDFYALKPADPQTALRAPQRSELVFIGRELDSGFFERGLQAALA